MSHNRHEHDEFMQKHVNKKVLIIDDNVDLVKILEIAFKTWGHEVRVAHDGFIGLEIAHEFVPDVAIIDIGMPGMDGYSLCKILKRDPKLRNTIFIAETGWGSPEHRRLSKEAGFVYHLVKPFKLCSLQQLMNDNMSGKSNEITPL